MPQVTITASQRVFYDKTITLDDEQYQQFLEMGQDQHLIYPWLLDNDHDFENRDIVEYGDVNHLSVIHA